MRIEATWRLRVDEKTKQPVVRVEYRSDEPPEKHEEIHAAIVARAEALLHEYFGPNASLKNCRLECEQLRDPAPIPIPTPTPVPVEIANLPKAE